MYATNLGSKHRLKWNENATVFFFYFPLNMYLVGGRLALYTCGQVPCLLSSLSGDRSLADSIQKSARPVQGCD